MKKIVSIIMLVLFIITVSGCSAKDGHSQEGNENAEDKALLGQSLKGRYVEETIEFPQDLEHTAFISIAITPEGSLELYALNDGKYEKYIYVDRQWSKEDAQAFMEFSNIPDLVITKVFYGQDGRLYSLGDIFPSYQNVLYRLSDTGEFEKIEVKRFEETYEDWGDLNYRPENIKVLENGMIAAVYPWGVIEVYTSDGQTIVGEFNGGRSYALASHKNTIYYSSRNNNELLSIDMEKNEEGPIITVGSELSNNTIISYHEQTAYLCDTTGIHLNIEAGSIWETILDGSQSSLGMPSSNLVDFLLGSMDDYYIVLSSPNSIIIKYIFYDENAFSLPQTELSIFSINDNKTIRQAMVVFQEKYPEVRINFRVANLGGTITYDYGINDPSETITLNDHISSLNTELLANKGADILVLDNLPIDSYIEKGVLEDMARIFNPMIEGGEILSNIADNYNDEGKVYTMPIRFKLPIIYGCLDAINSADSIEELARYARNNNEIPLLYPSNYRSLAAWLLSTNYDQIINEDNEIDEEALRDFLESLKLISYAINASDDAKLDLMNTNNGSRIGYWVTSSVNVYKKAVQTNIEELGGLHDFAIPLAGTEKWQGSFRAINNSYKANGLVGINSAGSQKELALEFVKLLFSKEIQSYDFGDGFPINKEAMEDLINIDQGGYTFTVSDGDYYLQAMYPMKDVRDKIYEEIRNLNKPMLNDVTMLDMMLDEAERYLRGDITADQAVSNTLASINMYLSE